jgi:predicted nucleic acid-binding Zn ribbon protein
MGMAELFEVKGRMSKNIPGRDNNSSEHFCSACCKELLNKTTPRVEKKDLYSLPG